MSGKPSTFQIRLRLRQELRRRLDIEAQKRGITKAQELIARLEKSFEPDPIVGLTADVKKLLAIHGEKANA
jgi:hypothetical protein